MAEGARAAAGSCDTLQRVRRTGPGQAHAPEPPSPSLTGHNTRPGWWRGGGRARRRRGARRLNKPLIAEKGRQGGPRFFLRSTAQSQAWGFPLTSSVGSARTLRFLEICVMVVRFARTVCACVQKRESERRESKGSLPLSSLISALSFARREPSLPLLSRQCDAYPPSSSEWWPSLPSLAPPAARMR